MPAASPIAPGAVVSAAARVAGAAAARSVNAASASNHDGTVHAARPPAATGKRQPPLPRTVSALLQRLVAPIPPNSRARARAAVRDAAGAAVAGVAARGRAAGAVPIRAAAPRRAATETGTTAERSAESKTGAASSQNGQPDAKPASKPDQGSKPQIKPVAAKEQAPATTAGPPEKTADKGSKPAAAQSDTSAALNPQRLQR